MRPIVRPLPVMLLSLLLLGAATTAAAAQVERTRGNPAGTDSIKGLQRASCVLQLEFDSRNGGGGGGGGRAIDTQTLNALLTSTTLIDPAAKKVLDAGPELWPRLVQVELLPAGQSALKLSVIITPVVDAPVPPADAAGKLLQELASRAKLAVDAVAQRQDEALKQRRAAVEKELAAAQERFGEAHAKLSDARSAAQNANPNDQTGRNITQEMQQIEMNLAASRARLKIIEAEAEKPSARSPASSAAATTAAATRPDTASLWAELIQARTRAVAAARNVAQSPEGALSLARAEADLAEAKIRAASASSSSTTMSPPGSITATGFDSQDRWQGERVTLRASIAEQEARQGVLSERLAQATQKPTTQPPPPTQYDVEELSRREQHARQEVDELTQQLDQFRRDQQRGGGGSPRLYILDGRTVGGDRAE